MRSLPLIAALAALGLAACAHTPPPAAPAPRAEAVIEPSSGSTVHGTATFTPTPEGRVEVSLTLTGASPGLHGAHIHERGDCSAADASSAGGHWNPTHAPHGGPHAAHHHAGDLGNISVGADGTGTLTLERDFTVEAVIGKAIVVHAAADDLTSQPAGAAGPRIGCGVIRAAR